MRHPVELLMRALARLPLRPLRALGAGLGQVLFVLARRRRHIAMTNLRLCFPEWSEAERKRVARRSFIAFSQSVLDRAWLWHAPDAVVRARLKVTGAIDQLRGPQTVVGFGPHFFGMDAGGSALLQQVLNKGSTIYSPQSRPALDAWVRAGRLRFGDALLINRREGIKPIVKALREGRSLYLLPDMDLGPEESIFVPFFGVMAATVPSLPRLARLGRARVMPVVTRMTDTGYDVQVHPPWPDYPSDDVVADTALMNRRLEDWVRAMPEQYYWVHKRFKTRPPGEAPVY